DNNFWDDWKIKTPKPIMGRFGIHIEFFLIPMGIPIALFPFFEYDKNPAKEPFDIPSGGS
ncbi:MAG: hypothetical protein K8R68_00345, partial [Bacteroidales bacterium]|nr:hypothetical protein [Bacteroidales bacterium]